MTSFQHDVYVYTHVYVYVYLTSSRCRSLMCKLDTISLRCSLADPWWPWDDPWWCAAAPSAEIRVRGTNLGAFLKPVFGELMMILLPLFFYCFSPGWKCQIGDVWPISNGSCTRRRRASPVVEDPVNLPIAPVSSLQWISAGGFVVLYAPWKVNMEPKNGGLEDNVPFQLADFQVPC